MTRVFLQARMSSRRFPGKVLAPFRGRPLILHVLDAVDAAFEGAIPVTVLTSVDQSDDPLAAYLRSVGVDIVRGPLDDVFERFRVGVAERPCDSFIRVNGDSPLLAPAVLRQVMDRARRPDWDLITTAFPRTFPKGQNAEIIDVAALDRINRVELTAHDREHVTTFCYRHPEQFRIVNVTSGDPAAATRSFAVDTVADLDRLEALPAADLKAMGST